MGFEIFVRALVCHKVAQILVGMWESLDKKLWSAQADVPGYMTKAALLALASLLCMR